jgi:hypothetical protein
MSKGLGKVQRRALDTILSTPRYLSSGEIAVAVFGHNTYAARVSTGRALRGLVDRGILMEPDRIGSGWSRYQWHVNNRYVTSLAIWSKTDLDAESNFVLAEQVVARVTTNGRRVCRAERLAEEADRRFSLKVWEDTQSHEKHLET